MKPSRKEAALWLLEKFVPGSGVNNLSFAFRVDGELNRSVLQRTLDALIRRHEVLRTVFWECDDANLSKRVLPADAMAVPVMQAPPDGPGVDARLTDFVSLPFQPNGSPLLRAVHLPLPDGHICCIAIHHSISDTPSTAVLLAEFASLYDTLGAGRQPPPEAVAPVPAWQEPAPSERSQAYWREQLRGLHAGQFELDCDRPEPARTTLVGNEATWLLSEQATAVVRRLQRQLRAPESVVLLSAYYLLLVAHGAGTDLTVGSPVSVRPRGAPIAVGYHSTLVALRARVDRAAGFRDLVNQVRRVFLEALTHADHAAEDLLQILPRQDSAWRNMLFRHLFNYLPSQGGATQFTIGGRKVEQVVVANGSSKFDLEFFVTSTPDSLTIRAAYCTHAFDEPDIRLLLRRYDTLLVAVGEDLDRPLGALSAWCAEDHEVIDTANATERPIEAATVLGAVAASVNEAPTAVAVVDGAREVTYQRLWGAAVATRDMLRDAGVGPGNVVALLAGRSADLAAATLGVWLVGAVYLPLSPDHPRRRIADQLADSSATVVLAATDSQLPAGHEVLPLVHVDTAADISGADLAGVADVVDPDECAYLIYTSGSTGEPKGTLVGHRGLANVSAYAARRLGAGPRDATLWLSTFSFDISAIELFVPLISGGRAVVAPDDARTDGEAMRALIRRHEISILQATPTTWQLVVDQVAEELAGRRVVSVGEPLPARLAHRLQATGCTLWNFYGPTEATVWSTGGRLRPGLAERIDVGTPIWNTKAFVAAPHGAALPIGLRGELCVTGVGVAIGYHNRPELTAQRFGVNDEYGRFYRTGDLARWLPDGRIEVLGRMDRQVKLHGNRIELGEVEAVLLAHPNVTAAAVVTVGTPGIDLSLAAFVTVPDRPEVIDELWTYTGTVLPHAAVPQTIIAVDVFPLSSNGKIDYPALVGLAQRHRDQAARTPAHQCGENELVDRLIELWCNVLGRPDVGPDSHFFANGGHSLLAAKLAQEIKNSTGVTLNLTDVFDRPTPSALADRLAEMTISDSGGR